MAKYIVWSTVSTVATMMGLKLIPRGVDQFNHVVTKIHIKSATDFWNTADAMVVGQEQAEVPDADEALTADSLSEWMASLPEQRLRTSKGVDRKDYKEYPENYVIIDDVVYARQGDNIYTLPNGDRIYFKPPGNGERMRTSGARIGTRMVASDNSAGEESSSEAAAESSSDAAAAAKAAASLDDIALTPAEMLKKMQEVQKKVKERNEMLEQLMKEDSYAP